MLLQGVAQIGGVIDVILNTIIFRWVLLLVILAIGASILSGMLDAIELIAKYGAVVLLVVGFLEIVSPAILEHAINRLGTIIDIIQELGTD